MFHLVSIGDIKLDSFVVLSDASVQCQLKMPECLLCLEYGAKILVDDIDSQIAGTAPNVAVGLARMKLKTATVSNMGTDGIREMALKHLKKEGVSTTHVRAVKGAKTTYSIVLNFKGEKTVLTAHNQTPYNLPERLATKWLYAGEMGSGYDRLFSSLIAQKKKSGTLIGFNPGTTQIEERKKIFFELIRHADALFVNREEAQKISKEENLEIHHLAKALFHLGSKHSVITDGRHGAYSFDGKKLLFTHAFPGKLVEATGAGDAFASGYIGALLKGLDAKQALAWGAVNSASVVGFVGPQKGLLTDGEIRKRLNAHPSFKVKTL